MQQKHFKVALIGQPNVGKSTVFNHLTGLNQHVGNWPGKTIEQKTGKINYKDYVIEICDLPGTYSLTSNSEEERISRDFIIKEKPEIVIVLLNATALERSFYLLSEVLLLEVPTILGINMADIAKANGIEINYSMLEEKLKIPVVELVASKNLGLYELVEKTIEVYEKKQKSVLPFSAIKSTHKRELDELSKILNGRIPKPYPLKWFSVKLLEGDKEITELSKKWLKDKWNEAHKILERHEDAYLDIVGSRYEWISEIISLTVKNQRPQEILITDRIDRYATHPYWGMALLLVIAATIFSLTYLVAIPMVNLLSSGISLLQSFLKDTFQSYLSPFFSGLLFDGVFGGAGMVIAFLPTLVFFFFFIGILEDVGYLSRIAYIMDNFMHRIGLHGKSFLPFFLGFGCNVPAILGTRIIEEKKARMLTIVLSPFIPCTARLAVLTFLAPAFFGRYSFLVMFALIMINLFAVFLIGKFLSKTLFKGEKSAFIMELPLYHMPDFKTISIYVYENIKSFIAKAATIIILVAGIVWVLANYPSGNIEESILASFGKTLEPLGTLMGFPDWRLSVALLTSFVAKENTVATLGILYGVSPETGLSERVSSVLSFPAALSFLIVQMLFIPCVASVAAIRQEAGWRWTFLSIILSLFVSVAAGIFTFQIIGLFYA